MTNVNKDLPKDYIITNVEVLEDKMLGEGAYGIVKIGRYYGLLCAVKKLKPSMFPAGMQQLDQQTELILQSFYNECEKMSKIRHPNIVQLLGVYSDSHNRLPVIVMELMNESLSRLLHRTKTLPFHVEVNIVHDIAQALAYLHSFKPPIVHRDISSNNILLNDSCRAKLTDLGVAKVAKGSFLSWDDTPAPGTLAYMPPEVRKIPADLTPAMDIFAIGINMIQIRTHKFPRPGPEYTSGRLGFNKMVSEKNRRRDHLDLIPKNDPFKALILDCIRDNPRNRPSGMKLCEATERLKAEVKYKESIELASAKSGGSDGIREQIDKLEYKIAELTEELADKTSQVERLERELKGERRYAEQVMEQSERCKLDYEIKLAQLTDGKITAKYSTALPGSNVDALDTIGPIASTSITTTKKKKRFKLKKLLRKRDSHKKSHKEADSLPQDRSLGDESGSVSDTNARSCHSDKAMDERTRFSFSLEKLSDTTEAFVDVVTEVVVEEEEEEEEEEGRVKPLSELTKHDYKVNRLRWYTHNCLPVGLHGSTLRVHTVSDHLCVCGGVLQDDSPNKSLLYCPIRNLTRWFKADSDVPQYFSASVVLQDELILIGGVSAVDGKCTTALSSYDFNAQVWVQRYPPLPTPRSSPSAFIYAEYLVVIGGQNDQREILSVVEVLHLPTQVWETSARLPVPVAGASTVVCGNIAYLVGGVGQSSCTQSVQSAPVRKILSSCHRFSILSSITSEFTSSKNIWKKLHECPFTKMTALCAGNQLLAFGGEQVTKSAQAEPAEWIWIYDQDENTWSPVQGMPSPRKLCAVTMSPEGDVVIIGGEPDHTKIDISEVMG